MAFWSYRAFFFDEKADYHGRAKFKKNQSTFKYGKGAYNVDLKNGSYWEDRPLFVPLWKRKTYLYPVNSSNPYRLDGKQQPPISPELYNINLETEIAKKLNDLSKKGFSEYLTPKNIIIALVLLGGYLYLHSKGTI